MSLLIQALKKAERARQAQLHDAELAKPSEALDRVLTLAPPESVSEAEFVSESAPEPKSAAQRLSLAPMAEPESGLDTAAGFMGTYIPSSDAAPAQPFSPAQPFPARSGAAADLPGSTGSVAPAARGHVDPPARSADMPGGATWRARPDAPAMRVAVLGGIALLIVGGFAYVYWQASSAPGPGARLPMVPMLAANPPAASPAPLLVAPEPELAPLAPVLPAMPAAPVAPPDSAAGTTLAAAEARLPVRDGRADDGRAEAPMPTPAPGRTRAPARSAAGAPAANTEPGSNAAAAPAGSDIKVTRNNAPQQVSPSLQGGYTAFNAGDMVAARQQYEAALRQDPNNRDALLGMAAIALREGQSGNAEALYLRLLELDPNDSDALAALIGLHQGDPVQSESRLKAILQRNPEAGPVLFALGNLLARQNRWPEAQQVYFRAFSSTPGNADYAFNLAVGLDRLGQGKLALSYYQRALVLASNSAGSFERGALRRRMHELGPAGTP